MGWPLPAPTPERASRMPLFPATDVKIPTPDEVGAALATAAGAAADEVEKRIRRTVGSVHIRISIPTPLGEVSGEVTLHINDAKQAG